MTCSVTSLTSISLLFHTHGVHQNVIIISPKIVISLSLRVACAKLKMDANFHFPIYWTKFFLNSGLSHSDLDTVLSQQARASLSAKDKD